MKNRDLLYRLLNKANQSQCTYRIAAIAFSKKGNILGITFNLWRFGGKGRGLHAERRLMQRYGSAISKIVICRTNGNGKMLPIDPCPTCQAIADKLGIKIESIEVEDNI